MQRLRIWRAVSNRTPHVSSESGSNGAVFVQVTSLLLCVRFRSGPSSSSGAPGFAANRPNPAAPSLSRAERAAHARVSDPARSPDLQKLMEQPLRKSPSTPEPVERNMDPEPVRDPSRYTSLDFLKGKKNKTPIPSEFQFKADLPIRREKADNDPVFGVREGEGYGLRSTRMQPVNPQWVKSQLPKRKPKRQEETIGDALLEDQRGHKITVDQCERILDVYAATKWYNFVWRFFRRFDMQTLRTYTSSLHVMLCTCIVLMEAAIMGAYLRERQAFRCMEERDQRDYKTVIYGMRASKVYEIGQKALEEEDPLVTLPLKQRMEIVVRRFRQLGLTQKDWELLKRKEKTDWIEDMDLFHMFYWIVIYVGNLTTGGKNMFDIDEIQNVAGGAKG